MKVFVYAKKANKNELHLKYKNEIVFPIFYKSVKILSENRYSRKLFCKTSNPTL